MNETSSEEEFCLSSSSEPSIFSNTPPRPLFAEMCKSATSAPPLVTVPPSESLPPLSRPMLRVAPIFSKSIFTASERSSADTEVPLIIAPKMSASTFSPLSFVPRSASKSALTMITASGSFMLPSPPSTIIAEIPERRAISATICAVSPSDCAEPPFMASISFSI